MAEMKFCLELFFLLFFCARIYFAGKEKKQLVVKWSFSCVIYMGFGIVHGSMVKA